MKNTGNSTEKPNILLIMADQMVPHLTGAYGHPVVRTPALDRLSREGVSFDSAYSPCPVCAPARASMMTGRYVSDIGAWDNAAPFGCDEPTFAHYLAGAGYDTALAGKMHFIGPDQLHGFARRFSTNIYPAGFDWTPVRGKAEVSERSHARYYVSENIHVGGWSDYLSYDEQAHFRAAEYLRVKGNERKTRSEAAPFFLTISYHHPHEPFQPPQKYWDLYEGSAIDIPEFPDDLESTYSAMDRWLNTNHGVAKEPLLKNPESLKKLRRAYYALVSYIDDKVADLLRLLEENGLGDTMVIFTSDHGDMLGEKGMVQKRTFYEWSSRVPLIVRFPGGERAGERCRIPVSLIDLFPTLLRAAGIPREEVPAGDGESLHSVLDGSVHGAGGRCVFSEYHSQGVHAPCFMIRRSNYKYILVHGHGSQLFDLEEDPGEWHNLSGNPAHAAVEEDLRSLILNRFDPVRIDLEAAESIRKRNVVKAAMEKTGTLWYADPDFDARKKSMAQYVP